MRFLLCTCWLLTVFLSPVAGEDHKPVELRFHGQVLSPSGDPVPHAKLTVFSGMDTSDRPPKVLAADQEGRFAFESPALFSVTIVASGLEGEWLGFHRISSWNARAVAQSTLSISLDDCERVTAIVTRDGKPVSGAHVIDSDSMAVPVETDAEGTAILTLPKRLGKYNHITAWHPELGVAGTQSAGEVHLKLQSTEPVSVRTVDESGMLVSDVQFESIIVYGKEAQPSWREESRWFSGAEWPSLLAKSNAGLKTIDWAPKDIVQLETYITSPEWLEMKVKSDLSTRIFDLVVRKKGSSDYLGG